MSQSDNILKLANEYYNLCCNAALTKLATIEKLPNGKYRVLSEKGKNLGTFPTRDAAKKRLRQVEYFKHLDKSHADDSEGIIDLTEVDDFAYSAIMRKVRSQCSKEQTKLFLKIFKSCFDAAVKEKIQKPEKVALQNALVKFNRVHKIKLDKKLVKNAAVSELGNPAQVGKYLSDIVKFTLSKIDPSKKPQVINSLKQKIYLLNENEIANKNMPVSSSMGQSITFIKHVLFNHDARYVRQVLNNIVRHLQ